MERLSHSVALVWFGRRAEPIRWPRWALLTSVAVGGSLLYGASLALVLPGWTITSAALFGLEPASMRSIPSKSSSTAAGTPGARLEGRGGLPRQASGNWSKLRAGYGCRFVSA